MISMLAAASRTYPAAPFGIRQMVYLGKNVVLCRDLSLGGQVRIGLPMRDSGTLYLDVVTSVLG